MPAQAAGPGTGNWPVGVGPHLAGGGRAHHGLVGRRELGGVEQAGAVDGDAVQSAEWGGSKVQVEAPGKAEPRNITPWVRSPDPSRFPQSDQTDSPPGILVFVK